MSFKKGTFPTQEINVKVPRTLYPKDGCPMKAEIQVRTILQHAFAEITHDLCYKSSFKVPDKWQRQVAAVAAALETSSNELEATVAGIQDYVANYGGTLSPAETQHEINKLSTILNFDKNNVELAGRIARLAITLGDWDKATSILQKFVDLEIPAACRDYGTALVKQHQNISNDKSKKAYKKGQDNLKIAAEYGDSEAMAAYASSWRRFKTKEAQTNVYDWYQKAYETNPLNTYAISNVIELEITRRKDLSVVSLMHPAINTALKHCMDQAEVGTNHPWAYYNAALFNVLLGKQEEGLGLLAKAIACSNAPFMLASACKSASRMIKALDQNDGIELMQQLLATGHASKGFTCSWSNKKQSMCSQMIPSPRNPLANHKGQVVIVAGDCGCKEYESVDKYRTLILDAFKGYKGIIISGGTEAGIAEVVGDIDEANSILTKAVGYLPHKLGNVNIDKSYTVRIRTKGDSFSAREPLQYWQDILSAGIDPTSVRVLGIGGGKIAALEYRIALAMGAKVIVVEGSGRAAKELLIDVHWKDFPNLIKLPEEMLTLRYLVKAPPKSLPKIIREDVAKAIHENYRQQQKHNIPSGDPAGKPWSKLPGYLKEANRGQADDIGEKLAFVGYEIKKSIAPIKKVTILKKVEVDLLSKMEHGRWNAQKLLAGWKCGPVKDGLKQTNPCIVKWDELSDSDKQKDINPVMAIPEMLAQVGYELK